MNDIPQQGKIYNVFDDGKIYKSRMYSVKVLRVIPFNKIEKYVKDLREEDVKECPWLYDTQTDFFIKTEMFSVECLSIEKIPAYYNENQMESVNY